MEKTLANDATNKGLISKVYKQFTQFTIEKANNLMKNEHQGLPWWLSGKEPACQCRRHGFHPWSRKTPPAAEQLREGSGARSSTLAWKIPWTEEPGGLQAMGSLLVRHN